jgi:hemerythrin superfamily protein
MHAIDLLESQHRDVETLFQMLEDAEDSQEKRRLFEELADTLAAHAAIEERIFYPQVLAEETEDELREAIEEHLAIKRSLADLLDLRVSDERFEPLLKVLKEQVEHHVGEEEDEMLPKLRKAFPAEQLEELGLQMESRFAALMQGAPRSDVPAETSAPAPLE